MHHLGEQPVGLVYLGLEPPDGGGLFRVELWPSPGQGDVELGHPALDPLPLCPGRPHGVGLVGVDVAQFLDVLAAADQQLILFLVDHDARRQWPLWLRFGLSLALHLDFLFLCGFVVLPVGRHAGVGVAVCH
ncbi:hypothetical protein HQ395_11125 [Aeromonas hydrophila]|nr:hypothetical protein [Aeromonas hydrophila]QWL79270.1 hypothetical protein HQ395_11125 [Aeromonas hydrophila]